MRKAEEPKKVSFPRDHPCSVAFVDETGSIARDRIFGVGLLKLGNAARVLRSVQKLRDKNHYYKEFKFSDVKKGTLDIYRNFLDLVIGDPEAQFFCFMADSEKADPVKRFGTHWEAYGKLAEQLTVAALKPGELMTVLADNYSTPDEILFEDVLKASVNRRVRRLAVTSVIRLDSKASDGLQAADMLTSGIAFEFRQSIGNANTGNVKSDLAEHIRQSLGCDSCLSGWRSRTHSIAVYNHGQWSQVDAEPADG